jgi:PEP-CTERM motif
MARKLTFAFALLVLVTAFAGASFANLIPTQITFGPNTVGSVSIGTTAAIFTSISGHAYQGSSAGSFSLSGADLTYANHSSPYTFGPNSQTFTVTIGPDTMTGYMDVEALFINAKYGFFAGSYDITSATAGFRDTGFATGQVVDIDFVTYKGNLSSGELIPSVPEPGTIGLVGSGLLAAAGMLRRKIKI